MDSESTTWEVCVEERRSRNWDGVEGRDGDGSFLVRVNRKNDGRFSHVAEATNILFYQKVK